MRPHPRPQQTAKVSRAWSTRCTPSQARRVSPLRCRPTPVSERPRTAAAGGRWDVIDRMLSGPSAPARQPQCVALCLRGTLLHCTGASKALLHVAARLLLGPAVVARLGHVLPLVACPWHAACSILGQRAHKYTSVGWMVAWLPSGLRWPLYTCEVASVSRPHVLARFDRLQRALRSSPEAFASPARALSHSGMPTLATRVTRNAGS